MGEAEVFDTKDTENTKDTKLEGWRFARSAIPTFAPDRHVLILRVFPSFVVSVSFVVK
jgi:hypothetical protein